MKKHIMLRLVAIFLIASAFFTVGANAQTCDLLDTVAKQEDSRSNAYINSFCGYLIAEGSGELELSFFVTGTGTMEKIGATGIYLYKSDGTYVTGFHYSTYTSFMGYNKTTHTGSVTYQAVAGQTYYAIFYFYAGRNGGCGYTTYVTRNITA